MGPRALLFLITLLLTTGCYREPPTPGDDATRLVVLLDSAPRTLDPRFTIDATSMRASRMVFEALVTVDNPTLEPTPQLAESITVDPTNPRLWHVRVRRGVRFHDGVELTGRDVVETFRSVADPALGSPYRADFARKIKDVRPDPAGDAWDVLFEVHRPYATFVTDLVLGIVPAHALGPGGVFPEGTYIGTGPFRYVRRDGERTLVLRRNPDWHGGTPGFEWLVFRTIEDENTRLLSLLGGSGDLVQNGISPVLIDVLSKRDGLRVETAESISFTYIGLNLRVPALADVRVRRALALGIDRASIVEHRYAGKALLATGMLAPFHWAYEGDVPRWPYDPARAEGLLDDAGFPRDPATGVRLTLELKLSNNRFRRSVAELVTRQLRAIGVDVRLRSYEFGTFFADIRKGNFDAFLLNLPEPVEPDMLRWMLHSMATPTKEPSGDRTPYEAADRRFVNPGAEGLVDDAVCGAWAREVIARGEAAKRGEAEVDMGSANRTWFFDPRFDCMVELGLRTVERAERRRYYAEAQRIAASELPVIPLWHEHNVAVMRDKVHGYRPIPNGRLAPLVGVTLGDGGP